jgi:hypothetical protein
MTTKKSNTENLEQVEESYISSLKNAGSIKIMPLVDKNKSKMGLENYDLVLFPKTFHEEQVAAIERNGVVKFITGLDEFAPEVQNIKDPDEKKAQIKKIRNVVAYLEKTLGSNVIDENDPDFWNKVKTVSPTNKQFWSNVRIKVGNIPVVLTPLNDPYDLIKLMVIEAGGFSIIAKSYEDAMAMDKHPDFYLDKENTAITVRTTYKKLRNRAIGILDSFNGKKKNKMFYLCRLLDVNGYGLNKSDSEDELYEILDDYISGEGMEKDKSKAAEKFIELAQEDEATLKLKAMAKDAQFYKFIIMRPDGMLYHSNSNAMIGRNSADVVSYLQNPLNQSVYETLLDELNTYWEY